MKKRILTITARSVYFPALLTVFVCVLSMVSGYIIAISKTTADKQRVEKLAEVANDGPSQLAALTTELERQTEESLERAERTELETWILIVAGILFLSSAKLLSTLSGRKVPSREVILKERDDEAAESRKPKNRSKTRGSAPSPVESKDEPFDPTYIDAAIERFGRGREAVIPILQTIQAHDRYLRTDALQRVCDRTDITAGQIIGVSSFYKQFRRTPVGLHLVRVCHGTACHVAGAQAVSDELRRTLGIAQDEDTDPRREFTIQEVACLGCCTLAPVVQIDQTTFGHLTPDQVPDILHQSLEAERNGKPKKDGFLTTSSAETGVLPTEIRVGLGSCCIAGGSGKVYEALQQAIEATGAQTRIKCVGCVGMCHQTPLVETVLPDQPSSFYAQVSPEDAAAIVNKHFRPTGLGNRIASTVGDWRQRVSGNGKAERIVRRAIDVRDPPVVAFLGRQKHIATEHFGRLDPVDYEEYVRHDGFKALKMCVRKRSPEDVIETVSNSGLRGRGGAGFPTGVKWSRVRSATGDQKYIICNGDEGDPGAFMDRMLMESFPYRIIEGMAIAAFAVGAEQGYFYIREEYPLAVARIRNALHVCQERGVLGDMFDTGNRLKLSVMEGAGAFVCGEETALLASMEGNRGSPRLRPPYPADQGLRGKPTLVNNVETYATLPWIIRNGPQEFARLGTPKSSGTKVFALAGKVRRGGLIEVPMGITIKEIVEEIGGGIKDDRSFKAVQIGGPSGGCIPAELADTPVDYEALAGVGAIMGSGGLVVLDETDCMVEIARYFLAFTQDQSCGKCTFCRIGTRRMLDILNRICAGEGRRDDLPALEELARSVASGSLCGLGKTAPNPVLSTLRYYYSEYEAHLEGHCPAGKCKDLITYRVTDGCIGCTLCAQHCSADAIDYRPYEIHKIDDELCTRCDTCRVKCPENAIEVV